MSTPPISSSTPIIVSEISYERRHPPVPAYEALPVVDRKLESSEICPITLNVPKKPVLYDEAVYDYEALIESYRTDGRNPVDRSPIDLQQLKRIVAPDTSSKA